MVYVCRFAVWTSSSPFNPRQLGTIRCFLGHNHPSFSYAALANYSIIYTIPPWKLYAKNHWI